MLFGSVAFDTPMVLVCLFAVWIVCAIVQRVGYRGSILAKRALKIVRFEINRNGPVYVYIKGRKSGLLSWLLTAIGIDPYTRIRINDKVIEFSEGSLFGSVAYMIPLQSVCNIGVGVSKPFWMLALGIVGLIFGVACTTGDNFVGAACGMAVFIVFIALYFFSKTLTLFFMPASANGVCIGLKRGVFENINIDENVLLEVSTIVSELVDKRAKRVDDGVNVDGGIHCKKCGKALELPIVPIRGQHILCPYCGEKFSA